MRVNSIISKIGQQAMPWFCMVAMLMMAGPVSAQGKKKKRKAKQAQINAADDTLALFRTLVSVSAFYKDFPIQGEIRVHTYSSIPDVQEIPEQRMLFSLSDSGSYVRLGMVEQIAQDSFILMVDHESERLMLMRKEVDLPQRINFLMNWLGSDSTIQSLASLFRIEKANDPENKISLKLKRKDLVPGTDKPAQELSLVYSSLNGLPDMVETITRRAWPITEDDYKLLVKRPALQYNLIHDGGQQWLFIQEDRMQYFFEKVSRNPAGRLPARISDRIQYVAGSGWRTRDAWKNYDLEISWID